MQIPLQKMEELETKYNIHLHIVQSPIEKDEYYQVIRLFPLAQDEYKFLGNTIEEVEKRLEYEYRKSKS